jgi:hypothetical protein
MSKEVLVSAIDHTRATLECTCDHVHGARDHAHSTYARVSCVALAPSLLMWSFCVQKYINNKLNHLQYDKSCRIGLYKGCQTSKTVRVSLPNLKD